MSIYDEIKCKYPLPVPDFPGANDLIYQTKDTKSHFLDNYEIREDGTLWHEIYDTVDKSDPNAKGFLRLLGCMARINQRWEKVEFTGEIRFYTSFGPKNENWIEFSAYF